MSARSDRFERMRDNWGQLTQGRIQLFARETARFSEEVIDEAISIVMTECNYAPVLKDVISACIAAEKSLVNRGRKGKRQNRFRPGDSGPDGRPTFSPEAARAELKRLRAANPEWFGRETPVRLLTPLTPVERRAALELMVSRIYVNGLRRCAALDGRSIIEAEQPHLF